MLLLFLSAIIICAFSTPNKVSLQNECTFNNLESGTYKVIIPVSGYSFYVYCLVDGTMFINPGQQALYHFHKASKGDLIFKLKEKAKYYKVSDIIDLHDDYDDDTSDASFEDEDDTTAEITLSSSEKESVNKTAQYIVYGVIIIMAIIFTFGICLLIYWWCCHHKKPSLMRNTNNDLSLIEEGEENEQETTPFIDIRSESTINKQKLLNNINEMVNNKTNAIHKQLETIKQYQTEVDSKRQEFENMIYNYQQTNAPFKDINLSQRNQYIIKQTYKILHSNNAQMAIVTQPNIKFALQTEQMKQFLNEEFILNSCDQPVPAAFTIIKIGFCFVQVSFNWQNKNVNEYEISVGLKKKLPKHKDENENKKKRKAAKIQSAFTNNSFTFGTNNNSNNNFSWNFGNQNNPFSNAQNPFSFPQNDVSPFKFGIDNKKEKKYEIFAKEQIKTEMVKAENNNDIDMKCDNEKEGLKHENIENIKWKSERYNASKYNNKYVTIYNLKSECEYLICIRGINACGWGNYSKYLSFTTKREPKCKKIDLEIIECRGYYRRSSNGQYYHPIHLLRDTSTTNKSYNNKYDFDFDAPIDELDEEYMYASDRGYTFEENEYDWIIFKPKKSKHRRYYITQIIIFGAGDTYMPKTFKIEIGDKKSLKLQKPVIDPEIHRKMKMKSSVKMKCAMPTYAPTMKIYKNKKSKKKKKLKKMKIKKKLKNKSKYVKHEELSSSESCDSEYVSSEDTSSDEKSSDSEYDKNKKDNCSKNKDREWIIMKPKVLETQLRYGRQVFNVKPKFISDRRCNYIKVSFMTSHNPNQMVKGNKFRLSRLEIWGIAIKD
eukprot:521215_1